MKEVQKKQGTVDDPLWLLSFYEIQFGKYQSKTFCWLLENDPGWCAYIGNTPDNEPDSNQARADSKSKFKSYMKTFPEGRELIRIKHRQDQQATRPVPSSYNAPVKIEESSTPATASSTRKRSLPEDGDKKGPARKPVKRRKLVSTPTGSSAPVIVSRAPDSPPPTASGATTTLLRQPASPIKDKEQDGDTLDINPIEESSDEEYLDPKSILGYDRVEAMAEYLMTFMEDECLISTNQAHHIIKLWKNLHPHDQYKTHPPHHKEKLTKGRFKATGSNVSAGVESMERSILGNNSAQASWPDANRIMECIFKKLNDYFPHHERKSGSLQHLRWDHILHAYRNIRTKILACAHVTSNTQLQLIDVNQSTLIQWLKKRSKYKERQTLEMKVSLAKPALVTNTPMPAPKEMPQMHIQQHVAERPNKAGQATMKKEAPLQTFVLTLPFGYYLQPASTEHPRNVPPVKTTPRSTLYSRKKREQAVQEGKQKSTYKPRKGPATCSKCNRVREKEQHHQYYGSWYCKRTHQESFEEWLRAKKMKMDDRKRQKK